MTTMFWQTPTSATTFLKQMENW